MNTQVTRYANRLAEAPHLCRAFGLIRSCSELVARLGEDDAIISALDCLQQAMDGLEKDIEIVRTEALADAVDAHSDWRREQRETENAV